MTARENLVDIMTLAEFLELTYGGEAMKDD